MKQSTKKKLAIFTEAGSDVGYGHLARTTALFESLIELNVLVDFFVSPEGSFFQQNKKIPMAVQKWRDSSEKVINQYDGIVIDSYKLNSKRLLEIRNNTSSLIVFDDTNRIEYNAAAIINPAGEHMYAFSEQNKGAQVFYGTQYFCLNNDIKKAAKSCIQSTIRCVQIHTGSALPFEQLISFVDSILDVLPNASIEIYSNTDMLTSQSQELINKKCVLYIRHQDILSAMKNADIAISACSQSLLELLALGVPSLCFLSAENQYPTASLLSDLKLLHSIGSLFEQEIQTRLKSALIHLKSPQIRSKIAQKTQFYIDGYGSNRLAKCILEII